MEPKLPLSQSMERCWFQHSSKETVLKVPFPKPECLALKRNKNICSNETRIAEQIETFDLPDQSFIRTIPKICFSASLTLIGCPSLFPGPTKYAISSSKSIFLHGSNTGGLSENQENLTSSLCKDNRCFLFPTWVWLNLSIWPMNVGPGYNNGRCAAMVRRR